MQSVKPLRLKRQAYRSATTADSRTVVNVWVDSGLSHLDGIYSYRCPNELLGKISMFRVSATPTWLSTGPVILIL